MLSISEPITSLSAARHYYTEDYAEIHSYFAQSKSNPVGTWLGKGAKRLGLAGAVQASDFEKLLCGIAPDGTRISQPSTKKQGIERRCGWDVCISAPKSLSIQMLAGRDQRLVDAFHRAAQLTMIEAEKLAARRRRGGSVQTGNLLLAAFPHFENRNLEPAAHVHFFVMNGTFDETATDKDGKLAPGWRALDTTQLHDQAKKRLTQIFRAELSSALRSLGYGIVIDEKGAPQISEVPKEVNDALSTRRKEIESYVNRWRKRAEFRGIVWTESLEAKISNQAAKATRKSKAKDRPEPEVLTARWQKICQALGFDPVKLKELSSQRCRERTKQDLIIESKLKRKVVQEAVSLTVQHCSERECVFKESDVEYHALSLPRFAGFFRLRDVKLELERRIRTGELIRAMSKRGEVVYTTRELQQTEQEMLHLVRKGRGVVDALATKEEAAWIVNTPNPDGLILNLGQRETCITLLLCRDQVTALSGRAGVGKSTVFGKVSEVAREQGYVVRALAPTHPATQNLIKDGLLAETVQSHLRKKPRGGRELWLVDEAGMIGVRDMLLLLKKAEAENARVILAGDPGQYASVPAGAAFRQLIEGGLFTVTLSEMVRQQNAPDEVRLAAKEIAEGSISKGLQRLFDSGRVFEHTQQEKRSQAVAEQYVRLCESGSTLVLAATNAERKELNEAIRAQLIQHGKVSQQGITTEVYLVKSLTSVMKKEAMSFDVGDVIRTKKATRFIPLKPDAYYQVMERDLRANQVTVLGPEGNRFTFDAKHLPVSTEIFTLEKRTFATRDRVIIRGTEKKASLRAGDELTIKELSDSGEVLALTRTGIEKRFLLRDVKQLDYTYCSTGHSAQGLTAENVILLSTSKHREEVVNRASAYVALTRTRGEVYLVTNDFHRAVEAMERVYEKDAALEITSTLSQKHSL